MERLDKLKEIRKKRKLSRRELAVRSGVDQNTIQRLEEGMYDVENVKLGTLTKLAKTLRCHILDFLDTKYRRIIR